MNYLKVPDSNIKLTDGSVVMLARFPGTKWVVHYGWYNYSGRNAMGWYFSSIPAETIIPVSNSDLQLIVLVDQGQTSDVPESIGDPSPMIPCPPGPTPGPSPCPPGPMPPRPPFNPTPDGLFPLPDGADRSPVSYFSKNDKYLLDASWISLPSIKYRDALSTIIKIPDGKVVKINNVDGKTRYYSWDAVDQRWNEKFYENDTEELLVDYYNKEEIDALLAALSSDVSDFESDITSRLAQLRSDMNTAVEELNRDIAEESNIRLEADSAEATARQQAVDAEAAARRAADETLQTAISALTRRMDEYENLDDILDRLTALEEAVFHIQKIVATSDDTVLVSQSGTLKDSGMMIGDDVIGEPSEYASSKTLATEKAVAQIVDENAAHWSSF